MIRSPISIKVIFRNFPEETKIPEVTVGMISQSNFSALFLKFGQLGKQPPHLLTHPVGKRTTGHLREGSRVYGVGIGGRLLLVQGSDGGAQGGGFVVVVEEAEEGCFWLFCHLTSAPNAVPCK
jgi:hypothetical protein